MNLPLNEEILEKIETIKKKLGYNRTEAIKTTVLITDNKAVWR